MHSTLLLQGWFLWVVDGVGLVLIVGALLIVVNVFRRPLVDFGGMGRAPWIAFQTLFLVLAAFDVVASAFKFASGLPKWFAGVVGAVVVLAAIQQIAYLLRVVYPSPKRLAQRDEQGESEIEP